VCLVGKTFTGISEIINELREISHDLQPITMNQQNLQLSLNNYIEQLNSKNNCRYNLYFEETAENVDHTIKLHSYRIISELLHNIHKHAKATIASLQITVEDNNYLELIVEDNGIGFQSGINLSDGIGLINVRNRVNICNGQINIDSSERGTTIIIELPLISQK